VTRHPGPEVTLPDSEISTAFAQLSEYLGSGLTGRISTFEGEFKGAHSGNLSTLLTQSRLTPSLIQHALTIKRATGQIHVLLHAMGILLSLQSVLEPGETVESLSLGAGNSPMRLCDLETNLRVAEFTFIDWKGDDSARQDKLFKDFFRLAESQTPKRRCLYVNSKEHAIKCLTGGRLCKSLLGRNVNVEKKFSAKYPSTMIARDYFHCKESEVEIVEIKLKELIAE
jgi:hypothetical protein